MNGINTRRNILKNILVIILNIIDSKGILLRRAEADSTESKRGSANISYPVSQTWNQGRFAPYRCFVAPCRHHLDEPARVARMRTKQVVLGVNAVVAVDGQGAATL